jgi:hypothetical protein
MYDETLFSGCVHHALCTCAGGVEEVGGALWLGDQQVLLVCTGRYGNQLAVIPSPPPGEGHHIWKTSDINTNQVPAVRRCVATQ